MGIIDNEATCDRTDRAELVESKLGVEVEREDRALSVKLHDDLAGKLDDGLIREAAAFENDATADFDKEGFRFGKNLDCRGAGLAEVTCGVSPSTFDELNLHDAGIELTLVDVAEGVVSNIVDVLEDQILRLGSR